ncbi:MAG: DegT/DnrJ/EryC1/StrS family aminotransferase [Minisyncoccales bacterium]
MYFVHPQIALNKKNFKKIFFSFFQTPDLEALNKKLAFYFPKKQIIFTDMGRSAFRIMIEKMNLRNTEMLFPAYICDTFFPIFKRYNIKPIFLDADIKTFNIKIEEIEKKITPQTSSIFVSHIYGLPNNITKIVSIAKKHNLKVIEDCAHSFGIKKGKNYLGNFGDASLFSLYKFLPVCRGGMLVCPKDWKIALEETSFNPRDFISFLNHFSFWALLFKKFGGLVSPKIIRKEKLFQIGGINKVSLMLFSCFFEEHQKNLNKRIKLASFFQKELKSLGFEIQKKKNNSFCYLSALMPERLKNQRQEFIKRLRKKGVSCTKMWHTPLIFNSELQKKYKLDSNNFPNAVNISQRIINFPLQDSFQKKDIKEIIGKIKSTCLDIKV